MTEWINESEWKREEGKKEKSVEEWRKVSPLEEGTASFPIIILFSSQFNWASGDRFFASGDWLIFNFEGDKLISSKLYKSLRWKMLLILETPLLTRITLVGV